MKSFKVALIGRSNVGKSTLFNRLSEKKQAIVSTLVGTTRDRNYTTIDWNDQQFFLVDTAGLDLVHQKQLEKDVINQAKIAIEEADLILLLIDVKEGVMPDDQDVAKFLQRIKKQIILVANKADKLKLRQTTNEIAKLNLGDPAFISAINGSGTGDLLDIVTEKLKHTKSKRSSKKLPEQAIKLAIIGKPNVGKSSIINKIINENRVVVNESPHTTRDSQNIYFKHNQKDFMLIDTAGINRKSKVKEYIEKQSVEQSLAQAKQANVVAVVLDISKEVTSQDKHILDYITENKKPCLLIANKWDLIHDKDTTTINEYSKYIQRTIPFLTWAPVLFTSAKEGTRIRKILDVAAEIHEETSKKINANILDKFIRKLVKKHKPTKGKGTNYPFILNFKQLEEGRDLPTFLITIGPNQCLASSYIRFIENNVREKFGWKGTPIKIIVENIK